MVRLNLSIHLLCILRAYKQQKASVSWPRITADNLQTHNKTTPHSHTPTRSIPPSFRCPLGDAARRLGPDRTFSAISPISRIRYHMDLSAEKSRIISCQSMRMSAICIGVQPRNITAIRLLVGHECVVVFSLAGYSALLPGLAVSRGSMIASDPPKDLPGI